MKHKKTIKKYVLAIFRSRKKGLMLLTSFTRAINDFLAIKKIDTYWKTVVVTMMKAPTELIKFTIVLPPMKPTAAHI